MDAKTVVDLIGLAVDCASKVIDVVAKARK